MHRPSARASLLAAAVLCTASGCAQMTRQACLAPGTWYALDARSPRPVPAAQLLGAIARRDVLLLGERHDSADDHQWQLQTLTALHALRPRLVIGFEAFPRRVQPVLDRWVMGELSERQFLEQSEWDKVWSYPAELYLPLLRFARTHRIPMLALNVERSLTRAVARHGWEGVPADQKEGVSRPAAASKAYRERLFEAYVEHRAADKAKSGEASPAQPEFLRFVESQTMWDRAMAEALALAARAPAGAQRPLLVAILGAGHVRHGDGVAHQLRDLGVREVAALLPLDADTDCGTLVPGLADAVFVLPAGAPEPVPPGP